MQDLLAQDGYVALDNIQLPGGQGFDNVLIKTENGVITDIIINESKQVTNGAISLSTTNCCTQISDDWINDVIGRMRNLNLNGNNLDLQNLGNELNLFKQNNEITQLVSGVNKNTGELLILNITGFN